jgi:hypothetical protein
MIHATALARHSQVRWFVVAMAFFILARELPPLAGLPAHVATAAAASAAGTGLVALLRRLMSRRRSSQRDPFSHSRRAPVASGPPHAPKVERTWS